MNEDDGLEKFKSLLNSIDSEEFHAKLGELYGLESYSELHRPLWYRRDGTAYTGPDAVLQWAKDFETSDHIVKQTLLDNQLFISTVFLGLDYSFTMDGLPILFETMVFDHGREGEKRYTDFEMRRYATEAEALEGHEEMCGIWRHWDRALHREFTEGSEE